LGSSPVTSSDWRSAMASVSFTKKPIARRLFRLVAKPAVGLSAGC
jgi:hypothetical protein